MQRLVAGDAHSSNCERPVSALAREETMRIFAASLLTISASLAACVTSAPPDSPAAANDARAERVGGVEGVGGVELPFEIVSNKPWVQVRVNGSAPQWFILDTGCAGASVIARDCARRLHLKLGDETQVSGLGAGEGVELGVTSTRDVTLDVGGVALHSPQLGVFALTHVEPYEGRSLDGLLGGDFMRAHVVEIDYARRKIRVYDPETFAYHGSAPPIPIAFDSGLVVAEAAMTPPGKAEIPCRVVIDTGVRTTVVWYHPFVLEKDLLASQSRVVTGTIGGGASGESKGDIGRLDSMKIGSLAIPTPTAVFSRDTSGVFAGTAEDGLVGGEILRRCKVTFDYAHERLYLEPNAGAFARFDSDMSGLFLVSAGPEFERVIVQSVAAGTPAADAGIAKGDEIVAIDERTVAGRTLDELRELFKNDGATFRLGVKRGGDARVVTMTLRRLV
jgi:hypothetical protein